MATTIGIQDVSQLKKDYGKERAYVIINITGNIVSGQVSRETVKQLSERFGKIMQDRTSLSINRQDTSVSKSHQLESAIPPSTISRLSSGEFVGIVANNPDQKITLKAFHAELQNDHSAIQKETDVYEQLPIVRKLDEQIIQRNYLQIKEDVQSIVHSEMERILADPSLVGLVVRRGND